MTLNETLAAQQKRIAELEAQLQSTARLTLKIGKSGTVCLYGVGRFPASYHKGTWMKILGEAERIKAFIQANDHLLSQGKDDPRFPKAEVAVESPKASFVAQLQAKQS